MSFWGRVPSRHIHALGQGADHARDYAVPDSPYWPHSFWVQA